MNQFLQCKYLKGNLSCSKQDLSLVLKSFLSGNRTDYQTLIKLRGWDLLDMDSKKISILFQYFTRNQAVKQSIPKLLSFLRLFYKIGRAHV